MRIINKINILYNIIITPHFSFVKLKNSQIIHILAFYRFRNFEIDKTVELPAIKLPQRVTRVKR